MDTEENVTHRITSEKLAVKIDLENTFEMSKEEFEKLPITKRFSAMWSQKYVDLSMYKHSYLAGLALFLFVSITELIILRNYVIPAVIEPSETRYWLKVLCGYLYYIATAHWLCTLLYNSYWDTNHRDNDILKNKTLWDDYDETLKLSQEKLVLEIPSNSSGKYVNRMLDYQPDPQTGLRWRFCVICQHDSPPRSHHCVLCNKCILKRDHHCYMTGRCIGFRNQKHFYFLCLFSFINCIIGFVSEGYYIIYHGNIGSLWSTLFILKALYMWLWTAELESHLFFIIVHLYLFPLIGAMCFGFVCLQTAIVTKGVTADEMKHSQKIKVNYGVFQRWQEVFGEYWMFNFVMPSQILFKQTGDGITWSGVMHLNNLSSAKLSK